MSNPASFIASRRAPLLSRKTTRTVAAPAALLIASGLGLFATGCGGGPAVVAVGPVYPCYGCAGYGYGYGYGYGSISSVAVAGSGGSSNSSGSSSTNASFQPVALAFDASGNLFIADPGSNSVREVAASAAQAGTSAAGSSTMSSAAVSKAVAVGPTFNNPSSVAVDPTGNVYVLDKSNGMIQRMAPATGSLAVVVGSPMAHSGFSGDHGLATSAQLNHPSSMAFDLSGNLFIADTGNHRVREVAAATGIITTIAGTGTTGYAGDGGPAAAAQISTPSAVAADTKGNVYIADSANGTVRKVNVSTGIISTVAGTGTIGYAGDNAAATAAQLNNPQGLALDPYGNLFISDAGNQTIREVAVHTGIISTVAGNHTQGYSGDGGASVKAQLNNPAAAAIDGSGNLYVADSGNGVIRKVLPDPQSTLASN